MYKFNRHMIVWVMVTLCLACTKNTSPGQEDNPLLGTEIAFDTAVVSYDQDPESGIQDTKLDMKFYNDTYTWEDGDKIKIVKYSYKSGHDTDAEYSYQSSKWTSASPLHWEDTGAHDFYAVYPSTASVSFVDPSLSYSDKAALVSVEVPKNQSNTNLGKNYAMAGTVHVDNPEAQMSFRMYPLFTVLRFVFYNRTGTSLRVSPTQLVGWDETSWPSEQFYLHGKFNVKTEASESSSSGSKMVSSSFDGFSETPSSRSIVLNAASTVSNYGNWGCQVYVVPNNYKRFVLTVNFTKGSNPMQTEQITYTASGNVFDPFKIHCLYLTVY